MSVNDAVLAAATAQVEAAAMDAGLRPEIAGFFDPATFTVTYVVHDPASRQAAIIDSVLDFDPASGRTKTASADAVIAYVREHDLEVTWLLETHAHADHVTGSWLMHEATGCAIGLAEAARADNVTRPLKHGDRIAFGNRFVEVRSTPGHTDGCISFVLDDHSMAFTGDALLVRGCGRCDFQQGNAHTLWRSITEQLLSLPEACLLYPGHDYTGRGVSSVAEEKAFNARLGGAASERDFVGHMQAMKLPHPHRIAVDEVDLQLGGAGLVDHRVEVELGGLGIFISPRSGPRAR